MAAVRHPGILISPYRTTHEVFSWVVFLYISLSNFVLIRYTVLKIYGFDFLQKWLEMPIHAPKISVFWGSGPLKIIVHRRDPQKAHLHLKPRIMSVIMRSIRCIFVTCTRDERICLSVCVCVCVCK